MSEARRNHAVRSMLGRAWSLLGRPDLALWIAYLLATPFYVFRSGRPQPAEGILLVTFLVTLQMKDRPLPRFLRLAILAIFAFATYAAVINLAWGVLLLDYRVEKVGAVGFASFYLFNAIVFSTCLLLYHRNGIRFAAATAWGTVGALALQLALMALMGGSGGYREKLFFNNPNQLGYYALLSAGIIAFAYQRARMPILIAASSLAITTLFAASSLSKAALIGTAVTACVAALRKPVLLVVTAAIVLGGMSVKSSDELAQRVRFRMTDMGQQSDDTLEGRGYLRIEMHPQYLVFGAAEVGHDRHGDFGGELHSSWATVLFSYGVVGLGLLLLFFWRALRLMRFADVLFLVPVIWYGMTHQGLRFRLFWVFIALVSVVAFHERARAAQQARLARMRPALVPA